jgi:hypothetical protein
MRVAHAARAKEPPPVAPSSDLGIALDEPRDAPKRNRVTAPLEDTEKPAAEPGPMPAPPPAPARRDDVTTAGGARPSGFPKRRSLAAIAGLGAAVALGAIFLARRQASKTAPVAVTHAALDASAPTSPSQGTPLVARRAVIVDDAGVGFDDLAFAPTLGRIVAPAAETGRVLLVEPRSANVESIDDFSRTPSLHGVHTQGVTSAAVVGRYLAVLDRSARSLALVDTTTRTVVTRHALAPTPDYVRFEEESGELWVTEPSAERIEVFAMDAARTKLERKTAIEVPGGPEHLVFFDGRAYTNLWHGSTAVIDLRTKRQKSTFPNGCDDSRTLALDPARALLFAACVEGRVVTIDLSHGNRIIGRFDYERGIDGLLFDRARGLLLVPSATAGRMAAVRIDADGQASISFEVTTAHGASCPAVDGDGRIWLCDPLGGGLLVISPPPG